MAHKLSG